MNGWNLVRFERWRTGISKDMTDVVRKGVVEEILEKYDGWIKVYTDCSVEGGVKNEEAVCVASVSCDNKKEGGRQVVQSVWGGYDSSGRSFGASEKKGLEGESGKGEEAGKLRWTG